MKDGGGGGQKPSRNKGTSESVFKWMSEYSSEYQTFMFDKSMTLQENFSYTLERNQQIVAVKFCSAGHKSQLKWVHMKGYSWTSHSFPTPPPMENSSCNQNCIRTGVWWFNQEVLHLLTMTWAETERSVQCPAHAGGQSEDPGVALGFSLKPGCASFWSSQSSCGLVTIGPKRCSCGEKIRVQNRLCIESCELRQSSLTLHLLSYRKRCD